MNNQKTDYKFAIFMMSTQIQNTNMGVGQVFLEKYRYVLVGVAVLSFVFSVPLTIAVMSFLKIIGVSWESSTSMLATAYPIALLLPLTITIIAKNILQKKAIRYQCARLGLDYNQAKQIMDNIKNKFFNMKVVYVALLSAFILGLTIQYSSSYQMKDYEHPQTGLFGSISYGTVTVIDDNIRMLVVLAQCMIAILVIIGLVVRHKYVKSIARESYETLNQPDIIKPDEQAKYAHLFIKYVVK